MKKIHRKNIITNISYFIIDHFTWNSDLCMVCDGEHIDHRQVSNSSGC